MLHTPLVREQPSPEDLALRGEGAGLTYAKLGRETQSTRAISDAAILLEVPQQTPFKEQRHTSNRI